MATATQPKQATGARTLVGWQGIRFTLPPEWNVTGFSMERGGGYLKVDSPDAMFAQIKWTERTEAPVRSLFDLTKRLLRRRGVLKPGAPVEPDLRSVLDSFLKDTGKRARKSKSGFDFKVKPETDEANGRRAAHHFSWSGADQGQGKIWHCRDCGRVVIAQIVGRARDNVSDVAAAMFGSIADHPDDGWNTWALYDLVAAAPEDFRLAGQKLMSGYLRLDFGRRGERLRIERWGLANVARKRFTLAEWFQNSCEPGHNAITESEIAGTAHSCVRAKGRVRGPLSLLKAIRDSAFSFRPPTCYEGVAWECETTNKIYAIQAWYNRRSEGLLGEALARCECH